MRASSPRSHGLQLHATLLSNGVRLSPALIDTLKAEGIRVMISLDGMGGQHDLQRPFASGKPSFHLVERTISRADRARPRPAPVDHDHQPQLLGPGGGRQVRAGARPDIQPQFLP